MPSTVAEIFTEIPRHFDPEAWGPEDAVLQFTITGDGGGQWHAIINEGKLTIVEGVGSEPSMTVTSTAQDFLAIVNGELSAVSAFMQGRVKVDGNMALAIKLQNLLS